MNPNLKTPSGKKFWIVSVFIFVVIVAIVVYLKRPQLLQVQTAIVERALVEETVSNTRVGSIKACNRSRLSPAIGGQVANLHVQEGDTVAAGEVLLELWNEDRKASLRQTKAHAKFVGAELQRACINADADERELKRIKQLAAKKLSSEEAVDQIETRSKMSRVACLSAGSKLEEAEAAIAMANAALQQTFLRAPFSGIVAEVTGEVGEYATPSPPGVATPPAIDLLTNDCHYLIAPIDEIDAADVRVGMPVRISLDAFPGKKYPGKVRRIAVYVLDVEKQARTVDIEVTFDNSEQQLIAGYSADVEVVLSVKKDALRVPSEAVNDEGRIFVLNDENIIEEREVLMGVSNWQFTEILSGLSEGEHAILSLGRDYIVPGIAAQDGD